MKLIGIMPVRNEAWCLGLSLRVALQWCDAVVVLDHDSKDDSVAILSDISDEVGYNRLRWTTVAGEWHEMEHREMVLEEARGMDASHIAIVDADEVLTANLVPSIRSHVEGLGTGQMLELPGYNLRHGIDQYHSNGIWGNRWFATCFKDTPAAHWAGDTFHHREPHGVQWMRWRPIKQGQGGVIHLWGASERRLRAKHALYKITETLRWPKKPRGEIDRLYNLALCPREPWEFAAVPDGWWNDGLITQRLNIDADPWQEAEARRLVAEHGRERFAGLDLFGVA